MANEIPSNLKYTKDHEWALIEGDVVTVGITDFAQSQLGDIVFVELPEVGTQLDSGATFGVIESIKSVSDLYAPIAGEVLAANNDLEGEPEKCNEAPYESWLIKIKCSQETELEGLLSPDDYEKVCE
jgi:glycine cleavage system H protein